MLSNVVLLPTLFFQGSQNPLEKPLVGLVIEFGILILQEFVSPI